MNSPNPPRRRGLPAVTIAVFALILALATSLLAWRATARAEDAMDQVEALAAARGALPGPPPGGLPPGGPPATTTADPIAVPAGTAPDGTETTGAVPTLNAQTEYKVNYTDQVLRIRAGSCTGDAYVDLDEPRVKFDAGQAELRYDQPCSAADTLQFQLENETAGSSVASEKVTPIECAEQIRTSPLALGEPEPVRRGSVYCVMTSSGAAKATGISWKMVILAVTATAEDGTVTLKASAWDIPG